jgi:uncharacterized membrane protein
MRIGYIALIATCAIALCIIGCGKKKPEEKKDSTPPAAESQPSQQETNQEWGASKTYRGFANFGHEVRTFQPCGSSTTYWVMDHSGQFWDLHHDLAPRVEPATQVFAIVQATLEPPPADGFGAGYPGMLIVEEVLYMTHEGLGCATYWNSFYYRTFGNEPSWSAEVSERRLTVTRPGMPDQTWDELSMERSENGIRYAGTASAGGAVELIITNIPCRDTMSGAYYGFTAALKLDSKTLQGCAVPGMNPMQN